MSERRKFNRWHLQPKDFVVVGHQPVSELQKKDVEEWINAISIPNREVCRVRKVHENNDRPIKRIKTNPRKGHQNIVGGIPTPRKISPARLRLHSRVIA